MKRTLPLKARELGKIVSGCKQHGGVAVMAAGMALARMLGAVGQIGLFVDRQGVDVGAESDGGTIFLAFECGHHPGSANSADEGNAHIGEAGADEVGGLVLLKRKFGLLMQAAPPLPVPYMVLIKVTFSRHAIP